MKDYFLHSLGHRMTGLVLESHLAIPGCSLQVPQRRHCHLKYNKVQSQQMAFTQSPSLSINPKILTNYLICSVSVLQKLDLGPIQKSNQTKLYIPDVLVLYSLHIKANGWNCRHNLSKFQLIQDRCLPLQFQDNDRY